MKNLFNLFLTILMLFAYSCDQPQSGNENNSSASAEEITDAKNQTNCIYNYNPSSTQVKWTAYKTTAKVAVSGVFSTVESKSHNQNAHSVAELIEGAAFEIPVSSVSSKNEERDGKIQKFFFGAMLSSKEVAGRLTNVKGDDEKGTLSIEMQINDSKQVLEAVYVVDDLYLDVSTQMRLPELGLAEAATSINEACFELHKGEDGESKLGDEVDIHIKTVLKKECE